MGCPRPPFASFLRLACRPRAPLEVPELVARRKELQSERLRLRPEIQELLVLGGSRELPGVLGEPAEPVVDLPKRRGVDALRGAGLLGRSCHLLHQAVHLSRRLAQRPPSREQLGQALRPPPDLILSRLRWPRITPVFAPTAASRVRRISSVVEMPGTSGMRSTRPPRARVSSRPAISSSGQSAPFTRTSGPRAATSARGVSSSKTITWSTAARPAST